ncbi:hypothetical protein CcI49_11650 [Frankia sp. CcI49]|uniref:hypothetical protein n=1 Tax=Frankia sp. CcI49 TaxID=1745382 RepID=UPI0009786BDD|nr:hypothetical protein [Frankia sp. CcI49]ONH60473.1 hypothetical protein CcI49_11650 [Frankia sp. CcI49]
MTTPPPAPNTPPAGAAGPSSPPAGGPATPDANRSEPLPDPPTGTNASNVLLEPRLKVARLHPSGILLDLPFRPPPGSTVHAATFWPDSGNPNGWSHLEWPRPPHGRGLQLPTVTDIGDVVSFRTISRPQLPPRGPRPGGIQGPANPAISRIHDWWGYLHATQGHAIVVHGPFPTLDAAYAAAQAALAAQVWQTNIDNVARVSGAGAGRAPPERAWREPAQPPATVSLTWHGDTATVGDPRFGWLHVDADGLAAALARPTRDLVRDLRPLVRGVDGTEAPVTLAALAALHLDELPDIRSSPSPPPPAAPTGPDLDGP